MRRLFGLILALALLAGLVPYAVFAEEAGEKYVRTIMMYDCGANLETDSGMATYNLLQILSAHFSRGDRVKFIVMTGGSMVWQLDSSYTVDPDTGDSCGIDTRYNQIWEAKGLDAEENPGKMVLLEKEGIRGVATEDPEDPFYEGELMSDPGTLKMFIDYCAENYPAEKYDLILWDHGCGPFGGFGSDQHDGGGGSYSMRFRQIMDAFGDNAVTRDGGKFDFIDFDACLMGSVEMVLSFSQYMDHYICSPELEPGYGQYYTGWLDALGEDPGIGTFELGRIMVDDFVEFYDKEEGDGSSAEGTLAVIDVNGLINSGFATTLSWLANHMIRQATVRTGYDSEYMFYDELDAPKNTILYGRGEYRYWDVGNLADQLGFDVKELTMSDVMDDGEIIDENEYTEVGAILNGILRREDVIYARGTEGIKSVNSVYRDAYGKTEYGSMETTGLHIFFPTADERYEIVDYIDKMTTVLNMIGPVTDPDAPDYGKDPETKTALADYLEALEYYALILQVGKGVSGLLDEGVSREDIDYDKVKSYLSFGLDPDNFDYMDPEQVKVVISDWYSIVRHLFEGIEGGEEALRPWLSEVISQQAAENVIKDDITVTSVLHKDGTGYIVQIDDTRKRVIDDIRYNLIAQLPAVQAFMDDPENEEIVSLLKPDLASCLIGSVSAEMMYEPEDDEGYVQWLNRPGSKWELDPLEEKWYAVKDSDGCYHVFDAQFDERYDEIYFKATYVNSAGEDSTAYLDFIGGKLDSIYFMTDEGVRCVPVSEYDGDYEFMPVKTAVAFVWDVDMPMSLSPIRITGDNAESITVEYTDVSNIKDIAPVKRGSEGLVKQIVVRDIYGYEVDITDLAADPAAELIDIAMADVEPAYYDGQPHTPVLTYGGEELTQGVDYDLYTDFGDRYTDEGEHELFVFGTGRFTGAGLKIFVILPAVPNEHNIPVTGVPASAVLIISVFAFAGLAAAVNIRRSGKKDD